MEIAALGTVADLVPLIGENRILVKQGLKCMLAETLYDDFVAAVRSRGISAGTGVFRTDMVVTLANHGPVTILIDSKKKF